MWKPLLFLTLMFAPPALANHVSLPAPKGEVILTVMGGNTNKNTGISTAFDMDLLHSLGESTLSTSTVWTDGVHSYSGVSLKDFLDAMDVTDGSLEMFAVNDYMVEVPIADAVDGGPIIAYAVDGAPMSLRDKGPLWLIYPYDSDAKYRNEEIFSRSIWQLNRINILSTP